ncbi:hypothetical protein NDU88_002775 [Pleurodeles waltl]|uniref:Uncharacterized protein n=1 Tax=Pleurodeles waltl TaxID=8319 RepID=A0AAV7W5J2_PLEWA|nr:hypothetical protein NDU88_002775 [Pleurodeles waltl]
MSNIEGAPHPRLAEAPWVLWGLVRGNKEQKGLVTCIRQEPQPHIELNAQLAPFRVRPLWLSVAAGPDPVSHP